MPDQSMSEHTAELARVQALLDHVQQRAVTALKGAKDAYERGLAEGLRQATEGWEREWQVEVPPSRWLPIAASQAPIYAGRPRQSRLVGPWEPAEQPEAVPEVTPRPDPGLRHRYVAEADYATCGLCRRIRSASVHAKPAPGGVVEPAEAASARQRPHQPGDVETCHTRAAGLVFRCHRCDITKANLDEETARRLVAEHAPASGGVVEPGGQEQQP